MRSDERNNSRFDEERKADEERSEHGAGDEARLGKSSAGRRVDDERRWVDAEGCESRDGIGTELISERTSDAHPREIGDVDCRSKGRECRTQPEEEREDPEECVAADRGDQHQCREQHQILDHVEMRTPGAAGHARQLAQALAVAGFVALPGVACAAECKLGSLGTIPIEMRDSRPTTTLKVNGQVAGSSTTSRTGCRPRSGR